MNVPDQKPVPFCNCSIKQKSECVACNQPAPVTVGEVSVVREVRAVPREPRLIWIGSGEDMPVMC